MTFSEAVDIALAEMREELSTTSMPTWESHARRCLEYWKPDRDLTTVTRLEVQAWINWRAKTGVKSSTIGHERCFLSRLWRVLEDRGMDSGLQCPLARLRMPKKRVDKRKISEEAVNALASRLSADDWDLVYFTLLTMLRRLEVFRIQAAHIIADGVDAHGNRRWKLLVVTSKTGRQRFVPLNAQALEIVMRRIEACKESGELYLFGAQDEDRFKAACAWAKAIWYPLIKEIGLGGQFHGLRHRGAHTAWKGKAPIETISKMLGHSSILQTEHYIGVTDDSMWLAAEAVAGLVIKKEAPAPAE